MKRGYEETTQYPVSKVLFAELEAAITFFFFWIAEQVRYIFKIRGCREDITTERNAPVQ